jgi:hypothetical protein
VPDPDSRSARSPYIWIPGSRATHAPRNDRLRISRTFHHNEAFVAVIFLAGFGVGFDALVTTSTQRFLPWYRRDEQTE